MKSIFDKVSYNCSEITTKSYSTSFSMGIRLFDTMIQKHVYAIYGFVRFADEIVDTFHEFNKEDLLNRFVNDMEIALKEKISLNPIINSFQHTVNKFNIDKNLIDTFINSMKMDLNPQKYTEETYNTYILGSAEVVGLMCLKVFVGGNQEEYERLKPTAMKFGSVLQKVNFLRDLNFDYNELNRSYFPQIQSDKITEKDLNLIFAEIEQEFKYAFSGIIQLPVSSRLGVYLAYRYYLKLYYKIKRSSTKKLLNERIRIPDYQKINILFRSYVRYRLNMY